MIKLNINLIVYLWEKSQLKPTKRIMYKHKGKGMIFSSDIPKIPVS